MEKPAKETKVPVSGAFHPFCRLILSSDILFLVSWPHEFNVQIKVPAPKIPQGKGTVLHAPIHNDASFQKQYMMCKFFYRNILPDLMLFLTLGNNLPYQPVIKPVRIQEAVLLLLGQLGLI